MSNSYLPADTKYLTNNGMKCVQDLTSDDLLGVISQSGELIFTKNYSIDEMKVDSLQLQTDGHYQTLLSTSNTEFTTYQKVLKDKEPTFPKVMFGDKELDSLSWDVCLFTAIFLNTYFKETDTGIVSNGKGKDSTRFMTIKWLYSNYTLFFPYNKVAKNYSCPKTNLFGNAENLELKLIKHFDSFRSIIALCKESHLAYTKAFSKMNFNSYRVANIFQVGLSLCGYKTRLNFNSNLKMFELTFTNIDYLLNHQYDLDTSINTFTEPIDTYSINLETPGKIIVSQNIDKNTTISILDIS